MQSRSESCLQPTRPPPHRAHMPSGVMNKPVITVACHFTPSARMPLRAPIYLLP